MIVLPTYSAVRGFVDFGSLDFGFWIFELEPILSVLSPLYRTLCPWQDKYVSYDMCHVWYDML